MHRGSEFSPTWPHQLSADRDLNDSNETWLDNLISQSAGRTVTVTGYLVNPFLRFGESLPRLSPSEKAIESDFTVIRNKDEVLFLALIYPEFQNQLRYMKFNPVGAFVGRVPGLVKDRKLLFELYSLQAQGTQRPSDHKVRNPQGSFASSLDTFNEFPIS